MAFTTPRTWVTGELVTASIMNTHVRDNFSFLAGFGVAGAAFSALTAFTDIARIAVGTYTGDGAATQAITGVGFQPRVVLTFANLDPHGGFSQIALKTSAQTTQALVSWNQYEDDHITAFGADGFTVGDGTGSTNGNTCNVNTNVYTYIALR